MNIIPLENKGLDTFAPEQQRLLRASLGLSDVWCGTIESAKQMNAIFCMCNQDIDTVLRLILSEFPTDIATHPALVLHKDEYLESFVFKSKHDQKGLEVGLIIAVHKVYTNLNATDRTADYLRAMGLKLVSSSEYLRLKNSLLDMENELASVASAWPPIGHEAHVDKIKKLVDLVASAQEPTISGLRNDMATLENRINALKEASVKMEQQLKVLDPMSANSDAVLNTVRDSVLDRMGELDKDKIDKLVAERTAEILSPGTTLFNNLLEDLAKFLPENKEFRDFIAKAVEMHSAELKKE